MTELNKEIDKQFAEAMIGQIDKAKMNFIKEIETMLDSFIEKYQSPNSYDGGWVWCIRPHQFTAIGERLWEFFKGNR